VRYLHAVKRFLLVVLLGSACGGGSQTSTTTPVGGGATGPTAPTKILVNVDDQGVALGGHDPIAYRNALKAVMGSPEHAAQHDGATYRFSSGENRAAFSADYAPAFGGYCAYAASQGRLSESDPLVFEIYDGQLLVFTNAEYKELFDQDRAGNKAKADAAWPSLVAAHGK
jgi:YHS domain-containing protein